MSDIDTAATAAASPFEDGAALLASEGLSPVDPRFVHVLRLRMLATALMLAIASTAADNVLIAKIDGPQGLLTVAAWLLALIAVVTLPARRARRWGYAMTAYSLRVARGWMVRIDTVVPLVRVQHIDVGESPLERLFGLAHLVVHTSGTHNSTVTLPGLTPDQASAMRAAIRQHIQTDFA